MSRDFGQLVKLVREFAQVDRNTLADRIERRPSYVAGMENGHRHVTLRDMEAIADAFNLPSVFDIIALQWKLKLANVIAQEATPGE